MHYAKLCKLIYRSHTFYCKTTTSLKTETISTQFEDTIWSRFCIETQENFILNERPFIHDVIPVVSLYKNAGITLPSLSGTAAQTIHSRPPGCLCNATWLVWTHSPTVTPCNGIISCIMWKNGRWPISGNLVLVG